MSKSKSKRINIQSQMLGPINVKFIFVWINSLKSIIWNYRILFMLIKKKWENKGQKSKKIWKCMLEKNMAANDLLKLDFWWPKTLRVKSWRIKIIWKQDFLKTIFESKERIKNVKTRGFWGMEKEPMQM